MKLYYNAASPFSRKVRVFAREAGLHPRVEEVLTAVSRSKVNTEYASINPLVKIPTLITEDGMSIFDSAVICEYLDCLHTGIKLFPPEGTKRWRHLRLQATCDEILDSGNFFRFETVDRPEHRKDWAFALSEKMRGGLDLLEAEVGVLGGGPSIGSISTACTLAWLDFRFGHQDWRVGRPKLAQWYPEFAARPSMQNTPPSSPPKL
ncbi:glutathione S-transferase family protein [Ottowia thiooxydans]|uniref:glutathione S-transferase family protein n=1 Tax=Ottowia thiooxydans TaxID=219182 RepID=UPI0003F6A0EE|nr:glutathione S-transferase [Ottowia thiooxydans]